MNAVYICYAREDKVLLKDLLMHLKPLQHLGLIDVLYSCDISAGNEWGLEIKEHMNAAQIILLLVSPDFLNSEYCYSVEMKRALDRHQRREALVIPVILRPVDWINAPFSALRVLPPEAKPITLWANRDAAFSVIAREIRSVVREHSLEHSLPLSTRETRSLSQDLHIVPIPTFNSARASLSSSRTSNARLALGKLLLLIRRDARLVLGKLLLLIRHYEAALDQYEQALRIHPRTPYPYLGKGEALLGLKRNDEALVAYQEAIRLAPYLSEAYEGQGKAYEQLAQQTYEELQQQARTCHEKARQLEVE